VSKIGVLREHLMRLYKAHVDDGMIPTSGRFLFYELIAAEIIPKHASGVLKPGATGQRRPDQDMSDALTSLRESGLIPWQAIVDETRSLDDFTGWPTIAEGVNAYLNALRLDPWAGAAPLILTESRSLAGVLRELIREYATLIAPTNGQAAGFLHTEVAPRLKTGTTGATVIAAAGYDAAISSSRNTIRRTGRLDTLDAGQ
jgi:hypothetical protein